MQLVCIIYIQTFTRSAGDGWNEWLAVDLKFMRTACLRCACVFHFFKLFCEGNEKVIIALTQYKHIIRLPQPHASNTSTKEQ